MYNPFVPFTETVFRETLRAGTYLFVIQRFRWPLVEAGRGFLVSAYGAAEAEGAHAHAVQLEAKEGKLVDVRSAEGLAAVERLVAKGSGYRLFLNKFRETNWKNRMMKLYRDKIIAYLRSRTPFRARDTIDITFWLEHGRVMATITNGERSITVPAAELIT